MSLLFDPEAHGKSAFHAVGNRQLPVLSPAVVPESSPLFRSPEPGGVGRRRESDQETVSPSSSHSESQPDTPVVPGPPSHIQGQDAFSWPSHSHYDENRQLLGTEEESSERQSSDEEEDKNIWIITQEQHNYYVTQFKMMQPNPRGVIPGVLAKEFFEKSRLPINELRKIWQLSDVTKDGCLSLEEFLTAMHLVVLRRNDIQLPDELPQCLKPSTLQNKLRDRHNKESYNTIEERLLLDMTDGDVVDVATSVGGKAGTDTDSALSPDGSLMSSPGRPKPVQFDAAIRDPNIACPVPLRLSPDSPYIQSSEEDSPATVGRQPTGGKREVVYEQLWNQEDLTSAAETIRADSDSCTDDSVHGVDDFNNIQPAAVDGPVSLPYFNQDYPNHPTNQAPVNPLGLQRKKDAPPSPPPRPSKTHARSRSLDLNHQLPHHPHHRAAAGAPHPHHAPSAAAPPFVPQRSAPHGAQGALRPSDSTSEDDDVAVPSVVSLSRDTRDSREVSASLHQYKETIGILTRTLAELGQEVADAVEERVVLEYQLDQLKSFGNDE